MISGTFKPGVSSLKPGDRVRETLTATGFVADYIVLTANCPYDDDTIYKLYTTYANQPNSRWASNQMPGSTVFISESGDLLGGDLFEGKSVQWSRI